MLSSIQNDFNVLVGSRWVATPENYSSSRWFELKPDGSGMAIFGYGQTIFANVLFKFAMGAESAIFLDYLASPEFGGSFHGFIPTPENAKKVLTFKLERGNYPGTQSITARKFVCDWKLRVSDSVWPAGMIFPYAVPSEFYGYRSWFETGGTSA